MGVHHVRRQRTTEVPFTDRNQPFQRWHEFTGTLYGNRRGLLNPVDAFDLRHCSTIDAMMRKLR
jgi:hypothetical protein